MLEPPARPTLATVAKLAGVSVASVSRVLNGSPASPAMERRVREAVDHVGYVPDAVARSLRAGQTHQLALAVADVGNPTYVAMMRAIEELVRARGYRLLVHSTGSSPADELELIANLRHGYVDGLIISPIRVTEAYVDALRGALVPAVVIGNLPEGAPIDNVRVDSGVGVRMAVEHLTATGRRRLGLVNGPVNTVPGSNRQRAFTEAVAAHGLAAEATPCETADDFTHAAGYEAARRLLARAEVDALVCANDLIAVGALRALSERKLRVPEDVAVIGMDDTELAQMCLPPLSSVSLQAAERGRLAGRMLLERLADPSLAPRRVTVPVRIVVRESSAPTGATEQEVRA